VRRALDVVAWLVVAFLLFPLIAIVAGSVTETPYVAFPPQGFTLRWYAMLMHRPDFLDAFITSVAVALLCTLAATGLGVLAAVGLHRLDFPGRGAIQAFLLSPLVLPTIVTGVALLQFYYLIDFDAPFIGLVIGHIVITIPYVVRTVGAGLVRLNPALEEAAESLGAGGLRILARVILAAVIFVFITSFDQATVSIFLSGPDMMPLPVRILNYIEFAVDPMVAAVSALLILFAFGLVAVLQRLLGLDRAFNA
jgi:putative spermidine/putrescine transport system permease protein